MAETDLREVDNTPTSGISFSGGVTLAGTAIHFLGSSQTQLHLTPGEDQTVIANWDLYQTDVDAARQQGGQKLQLRVYDVTDIDVDTDPPHTVQQFDCDESTDQIQVPVSQEGCDYIAEIGYVTDINQWLPLCRSNLVFVPASFTDESDEALEESSSSTDVSQLGENPPSASEITTNVADLTHAETTTVSVVTPPPSLLTLVVIAEQMVEARWDLPQADIDAVKQQGGVQLQLRVYDVTDVDLHTQSLDNIQQYDCDESTPELRVSIPQGDRNYASAIGYVTDDEQWLPLCCSDAVYVPALQPLEVESAELDAAVEETSTTMNLTGVPFSDAAVDETSTGVTPSEQILQPSCEIQHLTVHSRQHCLLLNLEQMAGLQETAVSHSLEPGLHIIRIKSGTFGYGMADYSREPLVLLWIYGGKFINKKTNIPVESTWSSLNGYDETLTLEVLETSTLCAFFFDTNPDDNYGEVTLSVVKL